MGTGAQVGEWPHRPPSAHQLIALIRALEASGAPITLSDHAEGRMLLRDLDMSDALRAFRIGDIIGPVEAGKNPDEWTCTVISPILRCPDVKREIGIWTVVIG